MLVSHAAVICLVTQRSSPLTAAETWTTFLARFKPITVAVPFSELARAKFSTRDSSNHSLRFIVDSGLKFVPTPVTDENYIRRQLLLDFEHFARRMRLKYISHKENKEPHPSHVKSDWKPPVQKSVALESYLENVKSQLAEIKPIKPKNNMSHNEYIALTELKKNTNIVLKKADKGTTTVIMNKCDKMQEAQIQLDNREHYKPLRHVKHLELSSTTCFGVSSAITPRKIQF